MAHVLTVYCMLLLLSAWKENLFTPLMILTNKYTLRMNESVTCFFFAWAVLFTVFRHKFLRTCGWQKFQMAAHVAFLKRDFNRKFNLFPSFTPYFRTS